MTIMPWTGPGMNPEQPWGSPQGLLGQRRRGGLFGASANIPQMPQTATEQPQKPGFDWRKLLGVLGDSLSIAGGGQAQYVPSLIENRQRQQAQAYADQQYQRRRQDENTDWMARQEYEAAHRPPPNPYRWESNDGSLMELGPDGQPRVAYKDPTPKIEWMTVDNGDGTKSVIPYGPNGPLGDSSGAPRRPKGKLTPYTGGQSGAPAGNFR